MNSFDWYYPRPQMKRNAYQLLNSGWKLNNQAIRVPFLPDLPLQVMKMTLAIR